MRSSNNKDDGYYSTKLVKIALVREVKVMEIRNAMILLLLFRRLRRNV